MFVAPATQAPQLWNPLLLKKIKKKHH